MKQVHFITYEGIFSDIGITTVYAFFPNGVWDENKLFYEEALKAYPLDEYEWIEIGENDI